MNKRTLSIVAAVALVGLPGCGSTTPAASTHDAQAIAQDGRRVAALQQRNDLQAARLENAYEQIHALRLALGKKQKTVTRTVVVTRELTRRQMIDRLEASPITYRQLTDLESKGIGYGTLYVTP